MQRTALHKLSNQITTNHGILSLAQLLQPTSIPLSRTIHSTHTISQDNNNDAHNTSTSSSHQNNTDASNSEQDVKTALFDRSLDFVHDHGWSREAVIAAAKDLNLSPAVAGMLEYDGQLVHYYMQKCNNDLRLQLSQEDMSEMRIRDKVAHGVKERLKMNTPYIESWSKALALAAQPPALLKTMSLYGDIADIIWVASGDKSLDFNYYTKRALAVGVYTSTELHMLNDCSPEYSDTWAFLSRRIDDVMSVGRTLSQFIPGRK